MPYNQIFDFLTGQFVKLLSPTCSWKMSITLNRLEYFDKILHTYWYWQDVAQEIVKYHLGLAEALPRIKFWKSKNSPISWTEWNILIKFCLNIDINKISPKRLRNDIFHQSRLCRAPNSEKVKMALSLELSGILWWHFAYTLILTSCTSWDCQMTFGISRGFAEVQILKKVKLALSLEPFAIFW